MTAAIAMLCYDAFPYLKCGNKYRSVWTLHIAYPTILTYDPLWCIGGRGRAAWLKLAHPHSRMRIRNCFGGLQSTGRSVEEKATGMWCKASNRYGAEGGGVEPLSLAGSTDYKSVPSTGLSPSLIKRQPYISAQERDW